MAKHTPKPSSHHSHRPVEPVKLPPLKAAPKPKPPEPAPAPQSVVEPAPPPKAGPRQFLFELSGHRGLLTYGSCALTIRSHAKDDFSEAEKQLLPQIVGILNEHFPFEP
jgi:hypothetical protein